jgi:hypothetical protein
MRLWDYGLGRSDEDTRVVMALWDGHFGTEVYEMIRE